jgi:hypothetical protein
MAYPLKKGEKPGMKTRITNHYDIGEKRPKLCCETKLLFTPVKGWSFAHHPCITFFKGLFYVIWSNGRMNEDDAGQRIMVSTSEDFDVWTDPIPFIDSKMGEKYEVVLSPGGFYIHDDILAFYYSQFEYIDEWMEDGHRKPGNKGHKNHKTWCITSKDGTNWSEPVFISETIGSNYPLALHSGRLLYPGSTYHAYTDNPDGIHGWTLAGIYPEEMDTSLFSDDSAGIELVKEYTGRSVSLCEGSFIQTEDDVIHMMLRSGTDYLWVTESCDDAETWSEPEPTNFTDNRTKFHFGRLPDGTFFYVGTPDPFPPRTRHVLALSLSKDGLDYTRHYILQDEQYKAQFIGLDKNGIYGYPKTMIHDGYLYITVSICKESIIVMRVLCEDMKI